MRLTHASEIAARATDMRRLILHMAHGSRGPHAGSALSCADIVAALYFSVLRLDPARPDDPDRDYFLLSKGHAAMTLYAALALRGVIDPSLLEGYMRDQGTLPAHLDRFACKGVEVSAGALGHGLPMGLGIARGLSMAGRPGHVFVLCGDGECQEGSVWEAAMMAPAVCADKLTCIVDFNNLQGYGRPCEIMSFEPLADKFASFGWAVFRVDGHDHAALAQALTSARDDGRPSAVICDTTKGKGVSFMEDELKWHYFIVTDELRDQALSELPSSLKG